MQLFRYYAKRLLKIAKANNVRVRMIGERSRFAPDIVEGIDSLERGDQGQYRPYLCDRRQLREPG